MSDVRVSPIRIRCEAPHTVHVRFAASLMALLKEDAMNKFMLAAVVLAATLVPTALAAQSPRAAEPTDQTATERTSTLALATPPSPQRASDVQLTSIITWLSSNFELEPTVTLPQVKYVSAANIAERRYRAFLGAAGPAASAPDAGRTTVAVYDPTEATIYLLDNWTRSTPADVSVLVHEVVHHLQHMAKTKFECPQAREQLAYAAQQRWLGLFDRNLEDEFQLDPFTLLVTTRCMY